MAKALTLLLLAVATGCADDKARQVTLTETDADQMLVVKVGEKITIKLKVLPSNGYVWRADLPPGLSQIAPTRFEPSSEQGKPGLSEVQVFEFTAKKRGIQDLRLSYVRINKVVKTHTFKLAVK